jgi:hypothetical protein
VSPEKPEPPNLNFSKAFSNTLHSNFTASYFLLHSKSRCRIVLVVVFRRVEIDESLASTLITILPAEEEKSSRINVNRCFCHGLFQRIHCLLSFRDPFKLCCLPKELLDRAAMIENSKMKIRKYTQIPIDPLSTPDDLDVVCGVIVRSMASSAQRSARSRRCEDKRDWKDCLCIFR